MGKSLALATVQLQLGEVGTELDIADVGKTHRAVLLAEAPFDPEIAAPVLSHYAPV